MATFHAEASCAAPAREVWKLLYDPVRFARWWPGWERVESDHLRTGRSGEQLTRYDARWPDFPYPTSVSTDATNGRVVVSCLLSDIVHTWTISPTPPGCQIAVTITVPDSEAAHAEDTIDLARRALPALVTEAESART